MTTLTRTFSTRDLNAVGEAAPHSPRDEDEYSDTATLSGDAAVESPSAAVQYSPDGVHRHLSPSGDIVFDLSLPDNYVLYRAPGERVHFPTDFEHFTQSAVDPPVQRLEVISPQFPWSFEVAVEHSFVRVADVLREMKATALAEINAPHYHLALQTKDGRQRMTSARERRCQTLSRDPNAEPPRCVDFLGEKSFLGGLRKDKDNAMVKRLAWPWARDMADTLVLVAEFVSRDQIQLVLEMRARAENGEL